MNKKFYTVKESSITYLFCILAMFIVSLLLTIIAIIISSQINVDYNEYLKTSDFINYLSMFLSSIIFLIVFVSLNAYTKKDYKTACRLKIKLDYKILIFVILLAVVLMLSCLNITGLFNYTINPNFPKENLETSNFGLFCLQIIFLAIMPAVFEELVFRGVIYNGLRQRFSAVSSIILSALLFMFIHLSIYKSFYQLILGLVLALLVYYTGTIIYGMVFHFVNNLSVLILNFIFKDSSPLEFLSWGTKEVLLSILFFAVGIGLTILFFFLLKKYTFKHKNYLNLEKSSKPLYQDFELENLEDQNSNNKNYKNNNLTTNDKSWIIISFAVVILFWLLFSIGG